MSAVRSIGGSAHRARDRRERAPHDALVAATRHERRRRRDNPRRRTASAARRLGQHMNREMDRKRRAGRGKRFQRLARRHRRGATARARQHKRLRDAWQGQFPSQRRRGRREGRHAGRQRVGNVARIRADGSVRPTALQIDRSPECSRATSCPLSCAATNSRFDLVERQRRGIDDALHPSGQCASISRGMIEPA